MELGNSQCQGVLLIRIIVYRQDPIVLAVGGSSDIFSLPFIFFFSLSFGKSPDIDLNTVSKGC